ncbi:MAG: beta-N-acetylhexosaminidase [Bacilli bacterium]
MELKDAIQTAKNYLGEVFFANLQISYLKCKDLNLLSVKRNGNNVEIQYGKKVSLFRGLTLVKEKKDEKEYHLTLKRHFDTDGLMLDCSRNGVMKVEKVKEMILSMALMGNNRLLLYTEDTYQLEKYPYFGYLRGGYSQEDIKEIVRYGEVFGVEFIPCIQTLGHLQQALKWEPMAHLRDGLSTVLVDDEETYRFIEEMVIFCRKCFKSKDIHIGMDESTEMGLHRYLQLNGFQDRVAMFSRHLSRVKEICKKYNFTPMIWSDMLFRLNSENEEYYRNTPLPEATLKLIPKDVKLVYWDYYHDTEKAYLDMIRFHKDTGNPIVFAGGAWRWKGYTPAITSSMENTHLALNTCLKEGVKEIFITGWGDDGNECSFFIVLPILAVSSVINYSGTYHEEAIDSLVSAVTGDSLNDFKTLDLPDQPAGKRLSSCYNPSKYFLYQDVLLGMFDDQVQKGFAEKYRQIATVLNKKSQKSQRYPYIYENLANLCRVLSHKVDLGLKLREAYQNHDKKRLTELIIKIKRTIKYLDVFQESVKAQWLCECRPFGYEVLDGRLGFLRNRLLTAKARVEDYLDDKIEQIEELEVKILPYDGGNHEVCWNHWLRNVSASNTF